MKFKIVAKIDHGNGVTENHCDNGAVIWKRNGLRHRDNGPAVRYIDGSLEWWIKGKLHGDDGPAVVVPNDLNEWWKNGKKHCENGPAVVRLRGEAEYWFEGKQYDVSNAKELNAIVLKNELVETVSIKNTTTKRPKI